MNRCLSVAALVLCCATILRGQATVTIPPNDPVYDFIDGLLAAGLLDSTIVGHRPMSRREIGRVLAEAQRRLPRETAGSSWVSRSLSRYGALYPHEVTAKRPTARYGVETVAARYEVRGISSDGNGSIDVRLTPIVANRLGRSSVDGTTVNGLAGIDVPLTSWAAASATGRMSLLAERQQDARGKGALEQAYIRGVLRNVAISLGRDYVFLGQGETAGVMNSLNPRGFDMLRISSDRPFTLPSFLKNAGPIQGTAYLADLGATQSYPHARLFSYKLSARPAKRLEIGATVAEQVGGQGAPGGTFLQKAGDAFPLLDALLLHRDFHFSNKFVGMDFRLGVPNAQGLQLYLEGAFDDFDLRRARSVFTEDAAYIWGASMTCFRECGPLALTAEYHATGVRFYTHTHYASGYTADRQLIGNPLGPRARAAYLTLDVDRIEHRFRFAAAHEVRSGDKYRSVTTTPDDSDFRFEISERRPAERRWRSMITVTRGHPTAAVTTRMAGGLEHVENFGFESGAGRTNWLLELGFDFHPRGAIFR